MCVALYEVAGKVYVGDLTLCQRRMDYYTEETLLEWVNN